MTIAKFRFHTKWSRITLQFDKRCDQLCCVCRVSLDPKTVKVVSPCQTPIDAGRGLPVLDGDIYHYCPV